jgi:DNA-binding MarR family transcriptional regulator
MHVQQLPLDYAIVLQQISDDQGDGFDELAENLRLERSRLAHIVHALHHKGLIRLEGGGAAGREVWLSLSAKGKRLMSYLWPESNLALGY